MKLDAVNNRCSVNFRALDSVRVNFVYHHRWSPKGDVNLGSSWGIFKGLLLHWSVPVAARGLRRRSAAARLLRLWVPIPPRGHGCLSVVSGVFSDKGLCDGLITRPEDSYRLWCVVVCDLETSRRGASYIYDISSLRVKGFGGLLNAMNAMTTQQLSSGEFCILRYDTIPVESASAIISNNSKMPDFEL